MCIQKFTTILEASEYERVQKDEEDPKLGARSPCATFFLMAIGPMLYQVFLSAIDFVEVIFVQAAQGDMGTQICGTARYMASFMWPINALWTTASVLAVSSTIAKGQRDDCRYVITDLIRVLLVTYVVLPVPLYFLCPYLAELAAMPDYCIPESKKYCIATYSTMFFVNLFQIVTGVYMGSGNVFTYCIIQGSVLLIKCICDPLFLIALKLPIWSASVSTVLSMSIPAIVILLCLYSGKTVVRCHWSDFRRKFDWSCMQYIKGGIPSGLAMLVGAIPSMVMTRYIQLAGRNDGIYAETTTVLAGASTVSNLIGAFMLGATDALTPTGTYAFIRRRYTRLLKLFGWCFVPGIIGALIIQPIMIANPNLILTLFISGEECLKLATSLAPRMFLGQFLSPVGLTCTNLLVSTQRPLVGTVPQLLKAVSAVAVSAGLYYSSGSTLMRVMWVFLANDIIFAGSSILLALWPIVDLWKKSKAGDASTAGSSEVRETLLGNIV